MDPMEYGYDSDHISLSDLEEIEHALYSQIHYTDVKHDYDDDRTIESQSSAVIDQPRECLRRILHDVGNSQAHNVGNSQAESSLTDNVGSVVCQTTEVKLCHSKGVDKNNLHQVKLKKNKIAKKKGDIDKLNNNVIDEDYEFSRYSMKSKNESIKSESTVAIQKELKDTMKLSSKKLGKKLRSKLTGSDVKGTPGKLGKVLHDRTKDELGGSVCKGRITKRKERMNNSSGKEDQKANKQEKVTPSNRNLVDNNCNVLRKLTRRKVDYVDVTDDLSDEVDTDESVDFDDVQNNKSVKVTNCHEVDETDSDGSSVVCLGEEMDSLGNDLVLSIQSHEQPGVCRKLSSKNDIWHVDESDRTGSFHKRSRYFVECRNCRMTGHTDNNCPRSRKEKVCLLCGGRGHVMRRCPQASCHWCHSPGRLHTTRCWHTSDTICARCHFSGHHADVCPDLWRRYHSTITPGPIVQTRRCVAQKQCCNCGHLTNKHLYHECKRRRMYQKNIVSTPLVVSYKDHTISQRAETHKHKEQFSAGGINKFASTLVKKRRQKDINNGQSEKHMTSFQNRMKSVDSIRKSRSSINSDVFNNNIQKSKVCAKKDKAKSKLRKRVNCKALPQLRANFGESIDNCINRIPKKFRSKQRLIANAGVVTSGVRKNRKWKNGKKVTKGATGYGGVSNDGVMPLHVGSHGAGVLHAQGSVNRSKRAQARQAKRILKSLQ